MELVTSRMILLPVMRWPDLSKRMAKKGAAGKAAFWEGIPGSGGRGRNVRGGMWQSGM